MFDGDYTENPLDIVWKLRTRSIIRKQIASRKSVQEGKPDTICELLDEAAEEIKRLREQLERKRIWNLF